MNKLLIPLTYFLCLFFNYSKAASSDKQPILLTNSKERKIIVKKYIQSLKVQATIPKEMEKIVFSYLNGFSYDKLFYEKKDSKDVYTALTNKSLLLVQQDLDFLAGIFPDASMSNQKNMLFIGDGLYNLLFCSEEYIEVKLIYYYSRLFLLKKKLEYEESDSTTYKGLCSFQDKLSSYINDKCWKATCSDLGYYSRVPVVPKNVSIESMIAKFREQHKTYIAKNSEIAKKILTSLEMIKESSNKISGSDKKPKLLFLIYVMTSLYKYGKEELLKMITYLDHEIVKIRKEDTRLPNIRICTLNLNRVESSLASGSYSYDEGVFGLGYVSEHRPYYPFFSPAI